MNFNLNSGLLKEVHLDGWPCWRSMTIARSHGAHGVSRPTFKGEAATWGVGERARRTRASAELYDSPELSDPVSEHGISIICKLL
jgi:hypothetical protein